jgi:hypothetical protein
VVHQLLQRARTRRLPLRLLGIALSNLGRFDHQLELFGDAAPLHKAVDEIRQRHGYDALRVALSKPSKPSKKNKRGASGQGRRPPARDGA